MKNKIPPFEEIFSLENLFRSFKEFEKGKKHKSDVAEFKSRLMQNLLSLQSDIMFEKYKHGGYFHFKINDPKPRDIHKASVRDRVVHHTIYRALYPYFDQKFIFDSYSCRINKGSHKAIKRFEETARSESENYTKTLWVLKCDIRRCFASVDKGILKDLIGKHITCLRTLGVINSVVDSFTLCTDGKSIPLGNLTSQLFINIYLNEFDTYVKRIMKRNKYIRYADDFVLFSKNKNELILILQEIKRFLKERLKFEIHPDKVFIKTFVSGVDFLGWIHFPRHRILRTKTKKRMFNNLQNNPLKSVNSSYLGLLNHGNTRKLQNIILSMVE